MGYLISIGNPPTDSHLEEETLIAVKVHLENKLQQKDHQITDLGPFSDLNRLLDYW